MHSPHDGKFDINEDHFVESNLRLKRIHVMIIWQILFAGKLSKFGEENWEKNVPYKFIEFTTSSFCVHRLRFGMFHKQNVILQMLFLNTVFKVGSGSVFLELPLLILIVFAPDSNQFY